jgi:nitroreductase
MNVSDAINTRLTARAFLDKPVDGALVRQILETAKRAPSGGNLQPWRVWVLGGEEMARFKLLMKDKISANPRGEGTEYSIYPPELKEPYKSRRFKVGEVGGVDGAQPRDKAGVVEIWWLLHARMMPEVPRGAEAPRQAGRGCPDPLRSGHPSQHQEQAP